MTPERVREYAAEYDPQPIHLDEVIARDELFGRLVASGWHSLSATMRLVVDARPLGSAPLVGVGIDALRFLRPVLPGEVLRAEIEVLDVRRSGSRPGQGFLRMRIVTFNQDAAPVLTQDWTLMVPTREQPGA
jgi:acyl dehydratase